MEIPQIFQEVKLNTTPGRKNKRKSKFIKKRGGIFFAFLLAYFRKGEEYFLLFELIFEQRK